MTYNVQGDNNSFIFATKNVSSPSSSATNLSIYILHITSLISYINSYDDETNHLYVCNLIIFILFIHTYIPFNYLSMHIYIFDINLLNQ